VRDVEADLGYIKVMKRSRQILLVGILLSLASLVAVWASLSFFRQLGTSYASGYSEQAFQALAEGDPERKVLAELGPPLWEVGYRYYYYYRSRELVFLVDKKKGSASLARFSLATDEQKAPYSGIETLEQLTEMLGAPERRIDVDSGQSRDPDVKTLVYSEQDQGFHLPWWQYRLIYIHKESGKVTGKYSAIFWD
jgi:hypothetical protein